MQNYKLIKKKNWINIISYIQFRYIRIFFGSIIFKGRKLTTLNPWGSTTLEWTTPLKPEHGNWVGEIPEVHRWAYDYGKDGRAFISQTEPVGEQESKH